jgi:hypothetical protein
VPRKVNGGGFDLDDPAVDDVHRRRGSQDRDTVAELLPADVRANQGPAHRGERERPRLHAETVGLCRERLGCDGAGIALPGAEITADDAAPDELDAGGCCARHGGQGRDDGQDQGKAKKAHGPYFDACAR